MMENNDSRTSFLFERPTTTTHRRHRPLIDPMVLIILIPPTLVVLFLFLLAYVPKSIKPTSFKSIFNSFYIFIILLASLFRVLNREDNESSTNMVVENDQNQDVYGVNDESAESHESSYYDAGYSTFWDGALDVAENSDGQRTATTERRTSDYQSYRDSNRRIRRRIQRRIQRRKAKIRRRVTLYIPSAPAPAVAPAQAQAPEPEPAPAPSSPPEATISTPPKEQAQAPAPTTTPTPFIKNLKKMFTPGNKNKEHPSSKTSKLPPRPPQQPPELQHYDQNISSSSTLQSSGTPPPERPRLTPQPQREPEPEPKPLLYDRESSMSSSSHSWYIEEPPPLPPFDMPADRYAYYGDDYVRLRSINSNTSSSPDLQPMGQPSTSMDSRDSFSSSPDVNAKAGIFISKGKDKWKMEQENILKKKRRD